MDSPAAHHEHTVTVPVLLLIGVNLIPLYMATTGRWSIAEILLIFWLESLVVGGFHLAELLNCRPGKPRRKKDSAAIKESFVIYMTWTACLGVPLFGVLLLVDIEGVPVSSFEALRALVLSAPFGIVVAALFVSHGVSFYQDFLRSPRRHALAPSDLFLQPLGRVLTLQATLIIGTMAAILSGRLTWIVVTMVLFKTTVEVIYKLHSIRESSPRGGTTD